MFLSVKEYDVLKSPINQTFEGCKEKSKATLYVKQRDVGAILLTLRKKYTEIRCDLTGKVIPKRKWNDETKTAAANLLAKHKVSKAGWYVLYFLVLSSFAMLFYTIYSETKSIDNYNVSFSSKNDIEKTKLLSKLGEGDFIKTTDFVYKIKSIDNNTIIVYKGSVAKEPNSPIGEVQDFDMKSAIEINANAFWKHHFVNPDSEYGGELIMQILDN